jgi:hypothetical protein
MRAERAGNNEVFERSSVAPAVAPGRLEQCRMPHDEEPASLVLPAPWWSVWPWPVGLCDPDSLSIHFPLIPCLPEQASRALLTM